MRGLHPWLSRPGDDRPTPADRAADSDAAPLPTALGLFSVALGLAELTAPHTVAARTGVPYRAAHS